MLRTARVARGLSQNQVARMMKWSSAQFISNIERGIALPPPQIVPELARVLHIKPSSIFVAMYDWELERLKDKYQTYLK